MHNRNRNRNTRRTVRNTKRGFFSSVYRPIGYTLKTSDKIISKTSNVLQGIVHRGIVDIDSIGRRATSRADNTVKRIFSGRTRKVRHTRRRL